MVDHVLGEAADAVAAHLGDRAVGVVVRHVEVGVRDRSAGAHEDHAVGADAEVPVAEPLDGLGAHVEFAVEVLEDHEVVAQAVHLGEGEVPRSTP